MKYIFCTFCVNCILLSVLAQSTTIEVSHYVFPEFMQGTVLFKGGAKKIARLNYNALTEEMIYENGESKLALGILNSIDTVYVGDKVFFPFKNKLVNIVFHSKYEVYAVYRCSIKDPGKPAGYGGNSQVSSTTVISTYFANGKAYELKLPEEFELSPYTEYLLLKDGKLNEFTSMKQLLKIFSGKEDVIKEYIKKNNIKYEDQKSLITLISFAETL